jgi:tRNA G10  N-methylase Trm11
MPSRYLVQFAQAHEEFRLPELQSISELNGFTIQFLDDPECNDPKRPFMVLELENEEQARLLARRCILVKCVRMATYLGSLVSRRCGLRFAEPFTTTMVMGRPTRLSTK